MENNGKIATTEVQDWMSNVLKTFQGEKTMEADVWIDEAIYQIMSNEGVSEYDEELYNSYREDYYIICKNSQGKEVTWTW